MIKTDERVDKDIDSFLDGFGLEGIIDGRTVFEDESIVTILVGPQQPQEQHGVISNRSPLRAVRPTSRGRKTLHSLP